MLWMIIYSSNAQKNGRLYYTFSKISNNTKSLLSIIVCFKLQIFAHLSRHPKLSITIFNAKKPKKFLLQQVICQKYVVNYKWEKFQDNFILVLIPTVYPFFVFITLCAVELIKV